MDCQKDDTSKHSIRLNVHIMLHDTLKNQRGTKQVNPTQEESTRRKNTLHMENEIDFG